MNAASLTNENDLPRDQALEVELPPTPAGESRIHKLTAIMRKTGATVLITAALSFMIQGWHNWNSLERYYTFLGFSGMLAAFGLLCGLGFKDSKGARTFLAVATAFIPVHFSQLGAFIYSFHGQASKYLPQGLIFIADDPMSVLWTTAATMLLAFPVALLGYSALARAKAGSLTLVYLAANVLLLIPVRDPQTVFVLGTVLFAALTIVDYFSFAQAPGLKTVEGRLSRFLPYVPFAILLGRCAVYGPSLYLVSVILGALSTLMYINAPQTCRNHAATQNVRLLSFFPAYAAWRALIEECFPAGFAGSSSAMAVHVPFAIYIAILSLNADEDGPMYRRFAGLIAVSASLYQLIMVGGFITSLITIALSLVIFCAAFAVEEKGLFYAGGIGFFVGLFYNLRYAAHLYQLSPWIALAAIGVVAVVSSSYVERNYRGILIRVRNFRSSFQTWN